MDQVWEDWTIKIWNSLDLKNAEMHCGNVQFFFFYLLRIVAKWHVEHGVPLDEVEIYLMWEKLSLAKWLFDM